jgi:hypothetical protein
MITLSHLSDSVQIDYPEWEGYLSKIHLAFELVETSAGWDVWDNLIANDYRTCSIDRSILSETEGKNLDDFIIAHRGLTLNLAIGTDSNFFPFGPDKGDTGMFYVRIIDRKFGQFDQFKQFSKSWTLLMTTAPEYVLPDVTHQADFQIGTVRGLLYPQTGIDSKRTYGDFNGVTYGGNMYPVDIRRNIHETSFTQRCNEGLAAELLTFLSGATGRSQDITIIAPDDYYLFDVVQGASGTYTCKLIQNVIECKQLNYEEFEIPLRFWMKSAA